MDKDTSSKKDDSIPFKMITTTWEELIGNRDWYRVIVYRHPKVPVMIHRKGCFLTLMQELEHAAEIPGYLKKYALVIGKIEEAEEYAKKAVKEIGRPGWSRAKCCDGPPCVNYATIKYMRPQRRRKEPDFRISFKHPQRVWYSGGR